VIVIDASAIVCVLAEEADSELMASRLERMPGGPNRRFASTVTVWEAACALARIWNIDRSKGLEAVERFMAQADIVPVPPDMVITAAAVEAAQKYGRGAGYPGILNLGDCFSYATARHLGAALLFKGEDFSRTDIRTA
jgi:ribonuclease VapC